MALKFLRHRERNRIRIFLRELRTQSAGRPLRTLYAFNPLRSAILLIGGEKTGDDRWYEKFVPVADRLFENHLLELNKEKAI